MALWKDPASTGNPQTTPPGPASAHPAEKAPPAQTAASRPRPPEPPVKETIIAADLAIEGKIEGAGHVRLAGRFKGDVHVDGNLTIEPGAHLTGEVYAKTVIISGELHGNINGAARVELLESGVLAGDVKAQVFTVAAGSKMRGNIESGWDGKSGGGKPAVAPAARPAPAAKD